MADNFTMFKPTQPHFFKFVFEHHLQQRKLRIPRKFVRVYGEDLLASPEVELIVPDGATWRVGVEVIESDGSVWFQNGWHDFAEFYSLKDLNLLVFRYEGNFRFMVCIFDDSIIEIEYRSRVRPSEAVDDNFDNHEPDKGEANGVEIQCRVSSQYKGKRAVEVVDEPEWEQACCGFRANGVKIPCKAISMQRRGRMAREAVEESEGEQANGDEGERSVEVVEEAEEEHANWIEANGLEMLCRVSSQEKGDKAIEVVEEAEKDGIEANDDEGSEESEEEEGNDDESSEDYEEEEANDDSSNDESWCREIPSSKKRRQKSQSPYSPPPKMQRITSTNGGILSAIL